MQTPVCSLVVISLKSHLILSLAYVLQLYAFFWQEEAFEHKLLTSRFSNFLGAVGIRSVNSLADKLTGFDRSSDRNFKTSRNVYPGDFRCNIQEPHSKWHEVSANTIVDIMLTSDSIFKVIAGERLPLLFNHGLVHRYETHGSFAAFEWASIAPQASLVFDSCLIEAIDNWNKPNRIGGFLSCMASSIVTHAVSRLDAADGDSGSQETIETCLVANDCVRFQGFQIDLSHLKQCVGLVANVSRCLFDNDC